MATGTQLHCKKMRHPTREILINFQNSFTARLGTKFATKWSLHIPPHLKDIAALPCETVMFQKLHKFKKYITEDVLFWKEIYADLLT